MSQGLRKSYFSLNITYDEFYRVYEGTAKFVVTRAHDGRRIQFSANLLRRFLSHDGVRGLFVIVYDSNNKFQDIQKLS